MKEFISNLYNPRMMLPALKVSFVVGTALFIINHGVTWYDGAMTNQRWTSAFLSYVVPYLVSIHGRTATNKKGL